MWVQEVGWGDQVWLHGEDPRSMLAAFQAEGPVPAKLIGSRAWQRIPLGCVCGTTPKLALLHLSRGQMCPHSLPGSSGAPGTLWTLR